MPAVTYSDFWGPNVGAYSMIDGRMPRRDRIQRVVNRDGFRTFTALFNGLIGAATGSNVTATHRRVQALNNNNELGGLRTVEVVTDINRNTAAADVTALKEMVYDVKTRPAPYPADRSGNGGPAYS